MNQVCRSCYYQLRQLGVIARTLTFNAAVSLVHAFVFSGLGYCSSIFASLLGVRMEIGEVEVGPPGCGATYWWVQEV